MKRMRPSAGSSTLLNNGFAIDTTFVLFFLALEFGRSFMSFAFDGFLLGICLAMLLVLPFFFGSEAERPQFGKWLAGRILIAAFATFLGVLYSRSVGTLIPETFRFLPMTLLIATAMVSCYIQFYGLLKLRPAK